jgi:1-phosphofructokinase
MVVTVTLNPAIDVTGRLDKLRPGETNRLSESTVNTGGKGINAARLIKVLGGDVIAAGFADSRFISALNGLDHRFIRVDETRINMKVVDGGGVMTEINSPGVSVGAEAYGEMERLLLSVCTPDTVFVLSGSLPPDAPAGLYAGYIRMLRDKGARVVLDASGEALRLGALEQPDAVKPNRDEIAYIDRSAYKGFLAYSMGGEGACFAFGDKQWRIRALPVGVKSPSGAGDCMTGALAYALDRGSAPEDAALLAMASAQAAVTMPGTLCPPLRLIEEYKELLHDFVSPA